MFLEYCEDSDLKEFIERHEEKRLSEVDVYLRLKDRISYFYETYH
jgi:hypothetical protein